MLAAGIGSFFLTILAVLALGRINLTRALLDRPNERSLHMRPRPKIGGIAIVAGSVTATLLLQPAFPTALLCALIALTALSAADDVHYLSVVVRLAAHSIAAVVVVVSAPSEPLLLQCVGVLGVAWFANLFNFMDGSDGLAGGMALVGFAAIAAGAYDQAPQISIGAAATCGAVLAFLGFNFPPARIFMGDGGSIPIGFLAGSLGYLGAAAGWWPAWFVPLTFAPFVLDATLTLLRRILAGKKPWIAHREHLYQRLILSGWSHRRLALTAYAVMLVVAFGALLALRYQDEIQRVIIAVDLLFLVGCFWMAERYLKSHAVAP